MPNAQCPMPNAQSSSILNPQSSILNPQTSNLKPQSSIPNPNPEQVSANALPIKKIGSESAEEVVIRTPAVSFTIWTQQANKFDEVEKRVQYAHLNMEVDGGLPETAEGIAAEFAGVRTMSSETEALLEMPVAIAQVTLTLTPTPNPNP